MFTRDGDWLCFNGRRYAHITATPANAGGWVMLAESELFGGLDSIDTDEIDQQLSIIEGSLDLLAGVITDISFWSNNARFGSELETLGYLSELAQMFDSADVIKAKIAAAVKRIEKECFE